MGNKRVRNVVSADLWHEEQAEAERARLAARAVVLVSVTLKDVDLPEVELLRRLNGIGYVRKWATLENESGAVSVCDVQLDMPLGGGKPLTEAALCDELRGIGSISHIDLRFRDES